MRVELGYLPTAQDFSVGDITVASLPGLAEKRATMEKSEGVANGWIYAPSQEVSDLRGDGRVMPYPSRVFGLPKTHALTHATATDPAHLSFLVWMFGFITGMRLTDTKMGFLDATPIRPGTLHDIVWIGHGAQRALSFVDAFWRRHDCDPRISKGLSGVIHALFLSQGPRLLAFERFLYIYTAIDGCYKVWSRMNEGKSAPGGHSARLAWLCAELKTCTPTWIKDVVDARNNLMHEALFFDEPLGFAGFGGNSPQASQPANIILELRCLVSRFVCAMLSLPCADYIGSPVNMRRILGVTI